MKTRRDKIKIETAEERDLEAAIESVYRKYGTNLRAFYRDIYTELKRQETNKSSTEITRV